MSQKTLVYIGAFIGGTIGSLIPNLWGAGFLSFSSVILGGIGGLIGIFIVLKFL
ncbi:MAG TPA: hypothetical protein VG895_04855 [Patescibacteria group bacterium]|nr:hypothetical protein [Patescibacteria group bacterium]